MDVEAPPAAETPAAAPAADEVGSDAVGAVGVPAAAPAPAQAPAAETPPATALAGLVVQVDEESAANSLFSELLLKVAQVVRLVEGVRDGNGDPFSDAEWILISSLVDYFRSGMPPLKAGSTLRQFLATLLNRDPMAITKKFIAEEIELGKQTFKPQAVDLVKAARTFRDQVAEFVASQRDPKYHGVTELKSQTNPWRAQLNVPAEHRKVSDKFEQVNLGSFPTKKAAACAVFAFVEDDYRFDDEYVSKYSNRMISKEDFATMDDEMKAAAEVGRLAAEEAPGRLRHRPAAAPGAAAKPQAKSAAKPRAKPAAAKPRAKRPRSSSRPARADEDARSAAMRPPTAVVAPPGQAAAAEPLTEGQQHVASDVSEIDLSSNRALVLLVLRVVEATQFQPRDGVDLDDVARRLEPLVEPFIKSLQARSRSVSPRTTTAPAPPPPPLPEGVPPPPANVAQPVAAPAPAAAAPGNLMTDN